LSFGNWKSGNIMGEVQGGCSVARLWHCACGLWDFWPDVGREREEKNGACAAACVGRAAIGKLLDLDED